MAGPRQASGLERGSVSVFGHAPAAFLRMMAIHRMLSTHFPVARPVVGRGGGPCSPASRG